MDFEQSSIEWRKNKKYKGNGYFVYVCNYIHSNGKQCRRTVWSGYHRTTICYMTGEAYTDRYKYHVNRDTRCKKHLHHKKSST
jgi:hypothetical protein